METPKLDQNQFLKQVRERAQVVSKSARQKPGDVTERFGQLEDEGDQEMQDYLAIIRGAESQIQEFDVKIEISDDLELDFAAVPASNMKLDFSKERMKANLAQRRVQKRRRPQSWAWVAQSSGSAVQIEQNEGFSGNEINLSVKLEEDKTEEKSTETVEEPTKKPRGQNRFSTPAFSNNLMMDLGNFLKKSKKPGNDEKDKPNRSMSPENRVSPPKIVSPRPSKQTTPVHSPRSPVQSPDSAKYSGTSFSPKSNSPATDRKKVVVTSSSPRVASPLTIENKDRIHNIPMEVESEKKPSSDENLVENLMSKDRFDVHDVAEESDLITDHKSNQSVLGDEKIFKAEVDASGSALKDNESKGMDTFVKKPLPNSPPPPRPKPKSPALSSSAMLVKAAATSSQNQIVKEEEKKVVVNAKPRWLAELKLKKQKEEIPKKRRPPLTPKDVETTDQTSFKDDASSNKALPKWMQAEASKIQKKQESDVLQDQSRERLLTSGGELLSRFKESETEVKKEPSWLKELNRRKQSREVKTETTVKTNSDEQKAKIAAFDYRSNTEHDETVRKTSDVKEDSDEEFVSITNIKKRLSKKSRFIEGPSIPGKKVDMKVLLDKNVLDKREIETIHDLSKHEQTKANIEKDRMEKNNENRTLDSSTRVDTATVQLQDVEMGTEHGNGLDTTTDSDTSVQPMVTEEVAQIRKSNDVTPPLEKFENQHDVSVVDSIDKEPVPRVKSPESKERSLEIQPDKQAGMPCDDKKAHRSIDKQEIKGKSTGTLSGTFVKEIFGTDKPVDKSVETKNENYLGKRIFANKKGPTVPKKPPVIKTKPNIFKKSQPKVDDSGDQIEKKQLMSAGNSRTSSPVHKEMESVLRTDSPLSLEGSPLLREDRPVSREDQPVSREDRPVSREDHPVSREDHPVSREDRPVPREDRPVSREDRPVPREDRPVSREDSPLSQDDRPISRTNSPLSGKDSTISQKDCCLVQENRVASPVDSPLLRKETSMLNEKPISIDQPLSENQHVRGELPKPLRLKLVRVNSFEQAALSKPNNQPKGIEAQNAETEKVTKTAEEANDIVDGMNNGMEDNQPVSKSVNYGRKQYREGTKTGNSESQGIVSNISDIRKEVLDDKDSLEGKETGTKSRDAETEPVEILEDKNKDIVSSDKAVTQDAKDTAQDINVTAKDTKIVAHNAKVRGQDVMTTPHDTRPPTQDTKITTQDTNIAGLSAKVMGQGTMAQDTEIKIHETKVTANGSKIIDASKKKPLPPRIKPKPKIKPKGISKLPEDASKHLHEKNERNIENSARKEEQQNEKSLELSKMNHTKENVVENNEMINKNKTSDAVSLRSDSNNRSKHRRPVSMIEDVRPLSQNMQYGMRERTTSTSSNKRFSTELEKKQTACWFRGVLPANIENVDEYDDIPLWKKQLLARLKPADKTAKRELNSADREVKMRDGSSSKSSTSKEKRASSEKTDSQFTKEFSKKQTTGPKSDILKSPKDEEWV